MTRTARQPEIVSRPGDVPLRGCPIVTPLNGFIPHHVRRGEEKPKSGVPPFLARRAIPGQHYCRTFRRIGKWHQRGRERNGRERTASISHIGVQVKSKNIHYELPLLWLAHAPPANHLKMRDLLYPDKFLKPLTKRNSYLWFSLWICAFAFAGAIACFRMS